jgi:hypothetical protein
MWAANMVLGPLGLFLLHQSVKETRTIRFERPSWWRRGKRATA